MKKIEKIKVEEIDGRLILNDRYSTHPNDRLIFDKINEIIDVLNSTKGGYRIVPSKETKV